MNSRFVPVLLAPLLAYSASIPFSASTQAREVRELPPVIASAANSMSVPDTAISIYVRKANTAETVLTFNADVPRSPASTIKTLTTFIALDTLGPAYTWKTSAYGTGRIANGVLTGDLYLVGGGDPYMTSERWWSFVQGIRQTGIQDIRGNVIVDNSYFAPLGINRGAFDAQPYRSYNVFPDALLVNFQTSRFNLYVDPKRPRPVVTVDPWPANLIIDNRVRVGPGRCEGYDRGITFETPGNTNSTTVVLSGVLATACGSFSMNRAIMTPPEYAFGTFKTLWQQLGGSVSGGLKLGKVPADAHPLFTLESLTNAEIIRLVNKYSNNVMARDLLLTLGADQFGAPGTPDKGRNAVLSWLTQHKIKIPGLVLENGSGLSREERITVRGMGEMLDIAWHSPFMPEFAASLPLSATDGTLRNRFSGAGMQGRLRLKTGRIDDVSGLAGFINSASGNTYVVVILVNYPQAEQGLAEPIQAALVRWVFGQ